MAHDHAHDGRAEETRLVEVERNLLEKNDAYARQNRARFAAQGIVALNVLSSPGSGKTTLLVRTLQDLDGRFPFEVIEGDQQSSRDADRIRATGVRAVQINTGRACHLDAHRVGHALEELSLEEGTFLFVENVGNLVCPAAFDLGEARKVVILSVTEGDDKPLKYPDIFSVADMLIFSKVDLLPYVDFDIARCLGYAQRFRPGLEALEVSAKTGQGLPKWYAWLESLRPSSLAPLEG